VSTQESKPENDQGDCSRRNERSMKKRPNPATAHTQSQQLGAQTTSRSSALVRGRSTQFIANPCHWPQRPCQKRGYISAIFLPFHDTVDQKRMNSCALKHLFFEGVEQPKMSPENPGNTFSDALLMSRFQNFAADAAKNKPSSAWCFETAHRAVLIN